MLCIRFLGNISALTVSEVQTNRAWWCLTHTLPEAYARAAAAAYEDDGRGEESVRLLNEVISASRMVDLFINALHPSIPRSFPRSLLRHQLRRFSDGLRFWICCLQRREVSPIRHVVYTPLVLVI